MLGIRRLFLRPVITACLIAIFSGQSIAVEPQAGAPETGKFLKEETVSISARREQPISEAASNVYVITDEDIRHSGATDIPTVLRRIPGIEVMQITGADINVSARGDNQLTSNKMLVLVDGRSIYDDVLGTVWWKILPVTLPEIKRIEVLKGPASALYGFNAFDGVINIITKSPEEMKGTTLQFGGGELGTIMASAIQAGTAGKLGYRLSVGHDQNNQWNKKDTRGSDLNNSDSLAFRSNKFNLHTEYALSNESMLKLSGGLVDVNRFDGHVVDLVSESSQVTSSYMKGSYERPNFFLRGWWNHWDHPATETVNPLLTRVFRITDRDGNPNQSLTRDTYDVEAQHALEFGTTNRVTYGVNYRHNAVSSNFLQTFGREDRLGIYIQEEWHATEQLTAVAGLRYDLHSEINPTYSPRVALLYKPLAEHTFRAAGSVAYRPPTLFETLINSRGTVFPFGCPGTAPFPPFNGCAIFGSTALTGTGNTQPEQIISYEVGYQGWYLRHRLRLRADMFFNHISDIIALQAPNPLNKGKVDIYGGEAGLEFLATSWLTGFANYSYEEIGQAKNIIGTGQQRGAPRFKTNAGVRGEWTNGLNGEVSVNYVGASTYPINPFFYTAHTLPAAFIPPGLPPTPNTRVGSYVLLNMRAGYLFWQDKAEVAVTAFNALDDLHKEHPLGDIIGRRVMGWLTIKY